MPSLVEVVPQAGAHVWLYLPIAILLGALHGLEPGHSKTMMAAFIVAVRGTVGQAILLGVSAAISHTAIVWLVALGGQYVLRGMSPEGIEPYFQIASAAFVLAIAGWMLWRIRADQRHGGAGHAHAHSHEPARHERRALAPGDHGPDDHGPDDHGPDIRRIDTGHGTLALEIFEDGVPPRWRVRFEGAPPWVAADLGIVTSRDNGNEQLFAFADRGGYHESLEPIPEPHAFAARVSFGHGDHVHAYELAYAEPDGHHHGTHHHHGDHRDHGGHDLRHDDGHVHADALAQLAAPGAGMDAHERAHASEIGRRFANRNVTTSQIVAFGLTGGLIPCPAAITVLLLCLQLKRIGLAIGLVACFSVGVAATMVAAGVVAALGVRHVRERWTGFDALARRAPYASVGLMIAVALYMGMTGWLALAPA